MHSIDTKLLTVLKEVLIQNLRVHYVTVFNCRLALVACIVFKELQEKDCLPSVHQAHDVKLTLRVKHRPLPPEGVTKTSITQIVAPKKK